MRHTMQTLSLGLVACSLVACSLAPQYTRPDMPVPAELPSAGRGTPQSGKSLAELSEIGWASFYTDPALRQVIATALAHNRDLRATALAVESFQAQYRIQRAALFPAIDGDGSWAKQRAFSGGQYGTGEMYSVGVGITAYELDFFGRVRNLKEDALEQYLEQTETHRAAIVSLVRKPPAPTWACWPTGNCWPSARKPWAIRRPLLAWCSSALTAVSPTAWSWRRPAPRWSGYAAVWPSTSCSGPRTAMP